MACALETRGSCQTKPRAAREFQFLYQSCLGSLPALAEACRNGSRGNPPTISELHIESSSRSAYGFHGLQGYTQALGHEPVQAIEPVGLLRGLVGEIQAGAAREPAPAGRHI